MSPDNQFAVDAGSQMLSGFKVSEVDEQEGMLRLQRLSDRWIGKLMGIGGMGTAGDEIVRVAGRCGWRMVIGSHCRM
jgi:hypothetical protein